MNTTQVDWKNKPKLTKRICRIVFGDHHVAGLVGMGTDVEEIVVAIYLKSKKRTKKKKKGAIIIILFMGLVIKEGLLMNNAM